MDKRQISHILEEIGLLLELKGESPFKSNAYYNAARAISTLTEEIAALVASGGIRHVKGIGQAIAERLLADGARVIADAIPTASATTGAGSALRRIRISRRFRWTAPPTWKRWRPT